MATKYVSKNGWHFQYVLEDSQPFYTALVTYQGATASDTPIEEEDAPGIVKTIFPGSDETGYDPIY